MMRMCGCSHTEAMTRVNGGQYTGVETVAEVAGNTAAVPALQRFGIDRCCGAHLTLAEAAAAAGVPLDTLLAALNAETVPAR